MLQLQWPVMTVLAVLLAQFDGQVRHGRVVLSMWEGACATPVVTALDNHHSASIAGTIEVDFSEMLPKPAIFTNHGEMPPHDLAAKVNMAYAQLSPALKVRTAGLRWAVRRSHSAIRRRCQ